MLLESTEISNRLGVEPSEPCEERMVDEGELLDSVMELLEVCDGDPGSLEAAHELLKGYDQFRNPRCGEAHIRFSGDPCIFEGIEPCRVHQLAENSCGREGACGDDEGIMTHEVVSQPVLYREKVLDLLFAHHSPTVDQSSRVDSIDDVKKGSFTHGKVVTEGANITPAQVDPNSKVTDTSHYDVNVTSSKKRVVNATKSISSGTISSGKRLLLCSRGGTCPSAVDKSSRGDSHLGPDSSLCRIPSILTDEPEFLLSATKFQETPSKKWEKSVRDKKLNNKRAIQGLPKRIEFYSANHETQQRNLRYEAIQPRITQSFNPDTTVSTTYLGRVYEDSKTSLWNKNDHLFDTYEIPLNNKVRTLGLIHDLSGKSKWEIAVLVDTGASISLVSDSFIKRVTHEEVKIPPQRLILGDGREYKCEKAAKLLLELDSHLFEIVAWITPMSPDLQFIFGLQSMHEVEGLVDTRTYDLKFSSRSVPLIVPFDTILYPGKTTVLKLQPMCLPGDLLQQQEPHSKLKAEKVLCKFALPYDWRFDTLFLPFHEKVVVVSVQNSSDTPRVLKQGQSLGVIDLRANGYFYARHAGLETFLAENFMGPTDGVTRGECSRTRRPRA